MADPQSARTTPGKRCTCELCELSRRIDAVKASGTREELVALVDELADRCGHAELELEIDEAILAGHWPGAEDYARRILARVR